MNVAYSKFRDCVSHINHVQLAITGAKNKLTQSSSEGACKQNGWSEVVRNRSTRDELALGTGKFCCPRISERSGSPMTSSSQRSYSLADAFEHWSDPAGMQKRDELKKYSVRPIAYLFGHPETEHYWKMHDQWDERHQTLVRSFIQKLRKRELIATSFEAPITTKSHREKIAAELWDLLELDFDESEAKGHGLHLIRVRVWEPNEWKSHVDASNETTKTEGDRPHASFPHGENEFTHNADYTRVTIRGHSFVLAGISAQVLRLLHQATLAEDPWIPGKRLLEQAGAKSLHLPALFKRHRNPSWHELIERDGRGFYRLNLTSSSR